MNEIELLRAIKFDLSKLTNQQMISLKDIQVTLESGKLIVDLRIEGEVYCRRYRLINGDWIEKMILDDLR